MLLHEVAKELKLNRLSLNFCLEKHFIELSGKTRKHSKFWAFKATVKAICQIESL